MVFTSAIFILLFLPLLFIVYILFQKWMKNYILLFFSIAFFTWAEPKFVFVVLISALLDWISGKYIYKYREEGNWKSKAIVSFIVLQNIGILIFYKYTNFIVGNLNAVLSLLHLNPVVIARILLPIGVSFIVFEKITYGVDIYRKEGKPSESFADYLLYVFLFPKLLAGPIIKYHDIAQQLKTHTHDVDSIAAGATRFCYGFAKKVFIADTMGEVADQVFNLSSSELGFFNAWFGVMCYTLQIYFDFSGYSDMAIGLARIFGFRLFENFNSPYISKNFTEFWRRWHISLSTWIKNYLYIPLGGNRVSKPRMYFNLWFCFLLCGIWHGASWTFVMWGAYHGVFLIIDKLGWEKFQKRLPSSINIAITFVFTMVGWSLFRSANFSQMTLFLKTMFSPWATEAHFIYVTNNEIFFFILGLIMCFVPAFKRFESIKSGFTETNGFRFSALAASTLFFTLSVFKMSSMSYNPFLYFRF